MIKNPHSFFWKLKTRCLLKNVIKVYFFCKYNEIYFLLTEYDEIQNCIKINNNENEKKNNTSLCFLF